MRPILVICLAVLFFVTPCRADDSSPNAARSAAEKGDAKAQTSLGVIYTEEKGTPSSDAEAYVHGDPSARQKLQDSDFTNTPWSDAVDAATQAAEAAEEMLAVFAPLFIVFGLVALYFLPSIIAVGLKQKNSFAIFVLNTFLGWTGLGWIGALVWAFIK